MPRHRVLHLADSPYVGGVTSHILSVAEAFRDDPDWEIVLATLPGKRNDTTLLDKAATDDLNVSVIEMKSTFDLQVRERLRNFVDVNHIAVVHTHGYRGNVIANHSRLPVPIVTTSHGLAVQPTLRLRLWQAMHLQCMRHQDTVIACSGYVRDQLRQRGVPDDSLDVIRNACADAAQPMPEVTRSELGIDGDSVICLYVGRLDAGKHLDVVLDAMQQLPAVHLLVVGDGPTRAQFETAAADNHATFLGVKPDPRPYYAMADAVVLPTEMEALPMTLIEAAAFGKPAIASNVGGVPEVIKDGVTGTLVNDEAEWAAALTQVSDAETRKRMGAAARERYRECFSLDRLRQSLAATYERVTAG